jgi:acetoin utilization deacetylase AcuC-like enzyme
LRLSFHVYSAGFFPGTGSPVYCGEGKRGTNHAINIPLPSGSTTSALLFSSYTSAVSRAIQQFQPSAVVLQLGVDGHVGDPLVRGDGWRVGCAGFVSCAYWTFRILGHGSPLFESAFSTKIPLMILGGGGYNPHVCARVWTAVLHIFTSRVGFSNLKSGIFTDEEAEAFIDNVDRYLQSIEVPEHEFFIDYAPDFNLSGQRPMKANMT